MTAPLRIRNGPRRRTFHTHGVPLQAELAARPAIKANAWSKSRPILARAYREMREDGISAQQARHLVISLLLVSAS